MKKIIDTWFNAKTVLEELGEDTRLPETHSIAGYGLNTLTTINLPKHISGTTFRSYEVNEST
jgi:hypothetical protein